MLLILTAATGARTVAFALNRIIDRKIDALNPRTASRDLPSGKMSLGEALGVMLAGLAPLLRLGRPALAGSASSCRRSR